MVNFASKAYQVMHCFRKADNSEHYRVEAPFRAVGSSSKAAVCKTALDQCNSDTALQYLSHAT